MDSESSIRETWRNKPLEAGIVIYAQIPRDVRPAWAAGILSICCSRFSTVPTPIQRVLTIARDPEQWHQMHDAFSAVRQITLAEGEPVDGALHSLLRVAENTAKVIYNASGSSAPFDESSGARLVRCAREFSDCLRNDEFTERLWGMLIANTTLGA
jgi:hypothetical protein